MPKMTLTFNLECPDDKAEAMCAVHGRSMQLTLWNLIERHIRGKLKYDEELPEDYKKALEEVREFVLDDLSSRPCGSEILDQ